MDAAVGVLMDMDAVEDDRRISFPYPNDHISSPCGIDIAADGSFALVANFSGHTLARLDLHSGAMSTLIDDARLKSASGVAIAPDMSYALVANWSGHDIGRIDLKSLTATFVKVPNLKGPRRIAVAPDGQWALIDDASRGVGRFLSLIHI